MKIDEILTRQIAEESKPAGASSSAGGDDAFALFLQNEMAAVGPPAIFGAESPPSGGADSVSGDTTPALAGVQLLTPASAQTPEESSAISALDGVLTGFDSLTNALQGTSSTKQIASLIEQIGAQTAGLDEQVKSLPTGHQLKDVAEELKVMAYMESIKWKRGDYL
jgi:hypothetical protein